MRIPENKIRNRLGKETSGFAGDWMGAKKYVIWGEIR